MIIQHEEGIFCKQLMSDADFPNADIRQCINENGRAREIIFRIVDAFLIFQISIQTRRSVRKNQRRIFITIAVKQNFRSEKCKLAQRVHFVEFRIA